MIKFIAVVLESVSTAISLKQLKHGNTGFEENSLMNRIAKETEAFFESQIKASSTRLNQTLRDIIVILLYTLSVNIFFNTSARKKILKIFRRFSVLLNLEIMLLIVFSLVIFFISLYSKNFVLAEKMFFSYHIICPLNVIIFLVIEVPILVCVSAKLIKMFGRWFILSCYVMSFTVDLAKLFGEIRLNKKDELVRIPLDVFPKKIQALLRREHLENSIYSSKVADNRRNAALIGFGSSKRIEVYGDFDVENFEELYPIILHEIGHSIDNTIVKRKIFKYVLAFCEMVVIMRIYIRRNREFKREDVSVEALFIMAFIAYLTSSRVLVFSILNVYIQRSEYFADRIAGEYGYGRQLSNTLFKMAVEHNTRMNPSFLFHVMTSHHPGVKSRVEVFERNL